MNIVFEVLIAAFTGAILQEVIYWYGQRENFIQPNHETDNDSPSISKDGKNRNANWKAYWAVTISMILGSTLGTYFWFYENLDSVELRDVLLTGAAFPTLLKVAMQSYIKSNKIETKMGGNSLKTGIYIYFGGRR